MVATTIFPAQIISMFKSTPKTRTKSTIRNNNHAVIVSTTSTITNFKSRYNSVLNPAFLKESSFIRPHHSPNTKEFRLQQRAIIQKIKAIMTSKARYDDVGLEELIMVDVIKRLGLEDYFKDEINVTIERLRANFCSLQTLEEGDNEFYEITLGFRLLRQDGYHVPADIFNKFKDKDGKFKQELSKDVKALLNLYESSQLSTSEPEEEILDEASVLSAQLLKASLNSIVEESNARIIENTLKNPYQKSLARLLANNFLHDVDISLKFFYNFSVKDWVKDIKELAIIDFDMALMTYNYELQQITAWRNELKLDEELSFARIDPNKWFMWSLGIIPGPYKSEERVELAKVVSFIYMIDDIFDNYGAYEYDDLYLFTEAINRWEYADIERLPKCMKVCFKALLATTNDFCSKIQMKHGWNPEQCLRKLWAELLNAHLTESKWMVANYSPIPEEYLKNGIISSGTHVVLAHTYFLMDQQINMKSLEELNSFPIIISSTAIILRLWNDTGIHTDKTPNGNDGSYVYWYMKEQKVSSFDSARRHVNGMISDAWKSLNKEYMSPTSPFSKDFKVACLNLARIVPLMYNK